MLAAAFLQAGALLPAARLPAALTSAPGTTSRPTGRAAVRQCAADTAPVQLWHVQLFNDDFNMREHVSRTLMMVADLSAEEANRVMQATNWNGAASVGTWEREVAEHIRQGMTQAGSRSMRRLVWPAEAADWPRLPGAGSRLPGLARVSASATVGTADPWRDLPPGPTTGWRPIVTPRLDRPQAGLRAGLEPALPDDGAEPALCYIPRGGRRAGPAR